MGCRLRGVTAIGSAGNHFAHIMGVVVNDTSNYINTAAVITTANS
jgi:hypothetical protein